jgi:Ser/Thr protein kinase RdoA (MazF antagonist)
MPLSAEEIDLMPLLVRARLAMTALITNWRASLYPHNRDYILRNAPAAWAGLAALDASPARLEIAP